MNNKELTELKKEFEALMDKFNYPEYGISLEEDREEIFDFFLPHLKSNDEIKREAVQEFMEYCWDGGEHDGWIISKADGYLETLTQKENNE